MSEVVSTAEQACGSQEPVSRSPTSGISRFLGQTWAISLLIALNILVFFAMAASFNSVLGFAPVQLAVWGGNSGLFDLSGQWWRLISYQFLHMNLWHVALNMWVLWSVGRATERLYGSFVLLAIYLLTGTIAGLFSVTWNPDAVSVGASGSIFGVLGAFLVFPYRSRNQAPLTILRYWLPALLFAGFSLYNGAYQPVIDNAAHVGGFAAGSVLGGILARRPEARQEHLHQRLALAAAFVAFCAAGLLWYIGAFSHRPSAFEQFAAGHRWYIDQEMRNILLWQTLAAQITANAISNDEIRDRFSREILPFWQTAYSRLKSEAAQQPTRNPFLPLVSDVARLRFYWAQAIIAAAKDNDPKQIQAAFQYAEQTNLAVARIDRLKIRMAAESLPRSLSDSTFGMWISEAIPGHGWHCVQPPPQIERSASAVDSSMDGPALRETVGCLAQRLFLTGSYAALDAQMKSATANLGDLPDGGSTLSGISAGLQDLFEYGRLGVEDAFRRTFQWRQAVPRSSEPDLVEAMIFDTWAYSARGHGYASSVSPQALQLYSARSEMAAATLREAPLSARNNPLWYQLSLGVGRSQSLPLDALEAIFDEGAAKFPGYLPLYRQMLVSLMPRWFGSTEQVNEFIIAESKKAGHGRIDPLTYARLYLIYGDLEGDDFNVVLSGNADSKIMHEGSEKLRQRYPWSDYILNAVARAACIDNDFAEYRAVRPSLNGHTSSTAWPNTLSVATCDKLAKS